MSSAAEQFPSDPDGDPSGGPGGGPGGGPHEQAGRRRQALQEQARTVLAEKVERAAEAHRAIARASAERARALDELRQWSADPVNARLLNPGYPNEAAVGPVLADAAASRRRVAAWEDQEIARRTVISEVACTLHLAERTAERLIGEASMFAGPMTATLETISRGEISYRHGQVLMDQLSFLPLEEAAVFEARLLPEATELTVGKLAVKARRMRERAHPETLTSRARAALADRAVWWEGRPDGMGTLTWYGTAQQTQAAHDRLTSIATATHTTERHDEDLPEDQQRTLSQITADAISDLLLDGVTPAGTGGGIHGNVMVTVPVLTAMSTSDTPGILEGYGPIPAEAAREIAGGAPSWTRLLTHPETGMVLSIGRDSYTVPAAMRQVLRLRDETCRFPGCNRPAARSDIDHTTAREHGGPTDLANLAHLCAPHHRLKHQSLWNVRQEPGGVLVWTSPAGAAHRTSPETYLGPPATRASAPPRDFVAPRPPDPTDDPTDDPTNDPTDDPAPF
jgi:hypothetical protein